MENILPFSGINFFVIMFGFIAFLHIFKNFLSTFISYKNLLFISVIAYILICMPDFYEIFAFLMYVYFVYWFFVSKKYQNVVIPMLVIALPMILHKLDINPIFKIIGISYITFRTIQSIVDSHNYGKLSFIEFTSFLLFPTTLLAGPIDRSYRFQEDLQKGYKNLTLSNIGKGWDILIVGVLFKFIFATVAIHKKGIFIMNLVIIEIKSISFKFLKSIVLKLKIPIIIKIITKTAKLTYLFFLTSSTF